MRRLPALTYDKMTADQKRVYDGIVKGVRGVPPQGPLLAALYRPELCEAWSRMGEVLRFHSTLPPRLREFTILMTARHWDSQFEWFAHEPFAREAGVSQDDIEAIRSGKGVFSKPDEQLVYDYGMSLLRRHKVDDDLYRRATEYFGAPVVVDLTALIGYYCMVALTLNAHEFGPPEGTPLPLQALAD